MLRELLEQILLEESVTEDDVNNAINNHSRVVINYQSDGKDDANGARVIEVYAYGLTKAGNPVIRAFEPYGDTTTKTPAWKFFRLDRITNWKETNQTFSMPASEIYKGLGDFNDSGDKTMSVVYKVAEFGDDNGVYKTDTERSIQRSREQIDNPITMKDLAQKPKAPQEPKLKQNTQPQTKEPTEPKADGPVGSVNNPQSQETPSEEELTDLRNKLGDTSDRINIGDLNNRLSGKDDNLYKTDTERGMEELRQKIANASKIDLSKIPRR